MAAGDEALALARKLDTDMTDSATVSPSKKMRLLLTEPKEVRANAPIEGYVQGVSKVSEGSSSSYFSGHTVPAYYRFKLEIGELSLTRCFNIWS